MMFCSRLQKKGASIKDSQNQSEYENMEDEGLFLCSMNDGQYGFFDAKNGSYACLYIGQLDCVYRYGMDDEARRLHQTLFQQ